MALLKKEELAQIEAAIVAAEKKTAGEIVVAVVRQSAFYDMPRAMITAAWALAGAVSLRMFCPAVPCLWILVSQIPMAAIIWLLFGLPPLLRRMVPPSHAIASVRARAFQLFAQHGVYRTRDKSGLLIMISELEHRVVILGDEGIHAHIGDKGWEQHVETITTGIKKGEAAAALLRVINTFGALLAEKFPRRPDDTNELPDHVVVEP